MKPLCQKWKCSLYELIPLEFRAKATCFISHAWGDPFQNLALRCSQEEAVWTDILVVSQFAGEQQQEQIKQLADVVRHINNTLLVIHGGTTVLNVNPIEPLSRSWCIFEICHSHKIRFSISWFVDRLDIAEKIRDLILGIDLRLASAKFESDKKLIDELALSVFGSFESINKKLKTVALKEFERGYRNAGTYNANNFEPGLRNDQANLFLSGNKLMSAPLAT